MKDISLEELLEAGCHFGHQVNRRNPRADEFIFEARDGVNIINLEKTREYLLEAARYIKNLSEKDGSLVIVATKRQARPIVEELIKKAQEKGVKNLFYVTSRWIGGTLTNFEEIKKNHKKLNDITELLSVGKKSGYTKRELVLMEKEKNKLESLYGGIKTLDRIPDALFIVDTHLETTAIKESKIMDVTNVGIVDTNANPGEVAYPIPANDDAVGSIKAIAEFIIDAWVEGQKTKDEKQKKEEKKEEKAAEKKEDIKVAKKDEKLTEKKEVKKNEGKKVKSEEKPAQTEGKTQKAKVPGLDKRSGAGKSTTQKSKVSEH